MKIYNFRREYICKINNYINDIYKNYDKKGKICLYDNYDAREYCSQGIQKLIVLAMKLSEICIFINDYDIKPILLLDDLFSELDEKNRNNIFKSLSNDIQIFITTTDLKNINKNILNKAKIYNLDEIGR